MRPEQQHQSAGRRRPPASATRSLSNTTKYKSNGNSWREPRSLQAIRYTPSILRLTSTTPGWEPLGRRKRKGAPRKRRPLEDQTKLTTDQKKSFSPNWMILGSCVPVTSPKLEAVTLVLMAENEVWLNTLKNSARN